MTLIPIIDAMITWGEKMRSCLNGSMENNHRLRPLAAVNIRRRLEARGKTLIEPAARRKKTRSDFGETRSDLNFSRSDLVLPRSHLVFRASHTGFLPRRQRPPHQPAIAPERQPAETTAGRRYCSLTVFGTGRTPQGWSAGARPPKREGQAKSRCPLKPQAAA